MDRFELGGHDHVELCDLLKVTGLCPSGGTAKAAIAGGLVAVDGAVELRKRCKIRRGQTVAFENHRIAVV